MGWNQHWLLSAQRVCVLISACVVFDAGAQTKVSPAAVAPATSKAPASCRQLGALIEESLKGVAQGMYGAGLDNSAPRESNRLQRALVHQATISNALVQMSAMGCPAHTAVLDPQDYQYAAMMCALETHDRAAACDLKLWRRNGEAKVAEVAPAAPSSPTPHAEVPQPVTTGPAECPAAAPDCSWGRKRGQ